MEGGPEETFADFEVLQQLNSDQDVIATAKPRKVL